MPLVPGREGRTLADAWNLTPEEVAAEYERLKRFRNAAPPPNKERSAANG